MTRSHAESLLRALRPDQPREVPPGGFVPFDGCRKGGPRKIFGIGFNKTGTTTLKSVLRGLGLSVADQKSQERLLTQPVLNGDYRDLAWFVNRYDAFQDLPFSQGLAFVACDALFPNAKFILTLRDEDDWYDSMIRFQQRRFGVEDLRSLGPEFFRGQDRYLAPGYAYENKRRLVTRADGCVAREDWSLLYDPAHYKALFRQRNEAILHYFRNRPQDLLAIDLSREKDTRQIAEFLGFSADKATPMPHENRTR